MTKKIENFALINPVSLICDKDRAELTRSDILNVILSKKIERLTLHYTAIDGKLKELKVPVCNRKQIETVLAEGERCDGSSLFKGIVDTSMSDLYIVPDYKTAFLNPFDENSLDFICRFITPSGELAPFAPDNILSNAANLFNKRTSLDLYALGEMEFFLLSENQSNEYPAPKQKGYHQGPPFAKTSEILNYMLNMLTQITGNVKYAHYEVGNLEYIRSDNPEINGKRVEQLEIEFLPTPILEAGDNIALSRWIIRNTAYQYGLTATFAPKLEEGLAGNGMHIHLALMKDAKNIMIDKNGVLSAESKKLIGGLCHYADSLTAYGNTVSSSYLRLVPNQEAPTSVCWSDMNRSSLIRVPLAWTKTNNLAMKINPQQTEPLNNVESRQTVELRSPDGSAFSHLLLAGIAMAVDWGFADKKASEIALASYSSGNSNENKAKFAGLPSLPASCAESAKILRQQRSLYERENIFPASVINYVASLLEQENDVNLHKRLLDMSADERLTESRRLMHKELHRH
ncbi:MAG: glutamine synthetase family protein [Candidatus Kapabacteria bacterium]|nr:glutamine synthetase family protein [Candidatus Kapabacteria bacterium]